MKFTVHKGVKYAAEIKLSGFEVIASDDYIASLLEEEGFTDVRIKHLSDEHRIAYGVWNGADGKTANLPAQVTYVEEA